MESCTYGPVAMKVIKTNPSTGITQIRSDDDTTYLYTRWVIDIIARISPETTSYNATDDIDDPEPNPGMMPGITVDAIKTILMQPRQRLTVVAGNTTILDTPAPNPAGGRYVCDALDGPRCEVLGITQIIGIVHFVAHLRFVAHVVDYTALSSPTGNVILSNLWMATEDVDELCYPTRTFDGEAILRTDVMRAFDAAGIGTSAGNPSTGPSFNADSLRQYFFFPVPNNYQRENVRVQLSSDGSRLQWSFTDVGRCYNLGAGSPIRKIEAYQDFYVQGGGPERALATHILQAPDTMLNSIDTPTAGQLLSPSTLRGLSNMRNTGSGARSALYLGNLPQYVKHCRVDVWGARDAFRPNLAQIAMSVCMNYAGGLNDNGILMIGTWQIIVRQALHHKFVSVEITTKWGQDVLAAVGLQNNQLAFPIPTPTAGINVPLNLGQVALGMGGDPQLRGSPPLGGQLVLDQTGSLQDNPGPTANCRGTKALIVALVAQMLQSPNTPPTPPTIPVP